MPTNVITPSGWGSYGDMWADRDKDREDQYGPYQPFDPKADKSPAWLKKASQGFNSYPAAPAPEPETPEPPRDLGNGIVSPWSDYGKKPEEQIDTAGIRNPWVDTSPPGDISESGSGIRDPWGSKPAQKPSSASQAGAMASLAPGKAAESTGAASSPVQEEPGLEGGIVRENPYGQAPKAEKPEENIGKKAGSAFLSGFNNAKSGEKGVDQYKPREAQNVEISGAKFRTADDGSVFFRGADGAEYTMNPQDPNVQRAMALDAQRTRPPAPQGDDWERIRRSK